MQQNAQPRRLSPVKRLLVLPAALLACLLVAGPASASVIAYSVYSPHREHNVRTGIYTSNPNGSGRARLTRGKNDFQAQWSPNKSHIAFIRTRFDQQVPNTLSSVETTLFSMRADGSRKTILWRGSGPVAGFDWAPDSDRLVYSRDGDLYVIDRRAMSEQKLTEAPSGGAEPDWSPDGTRIAYTGRTVSGDPLAPARNEDIYVIDAEGGEPVQVTTDTDYDFAARWSPDGSRIAFVSTRGHCCSSESYGSDIYVIDSDGTDEQRLTDDCTYKTSQQWTPDGSRIVYQSSPDDDACSFAPAESPLNVIDLGTGADRDLLPKRWGTAEEIDLSPDGRWLAFSGADPDRDIGGLFQVRLRDGLLRPIAKNKGKAVNADPDW